VSGPSDRLAAVRTAEADLAAAGRVALFAYRQQAPPLTVDVELAPENSVEK
jgi:hypothetical protein